MIKIKEYPSQEKLKELFEYRNGNLYWKKKASKYSNIKIGDRAGSIGNGKYYKQVGICNKLYLTHRLIYIYHNGDISNEIYVDHIDTDISNNNIENLRLADTHQSNYNTRIYKNNSSGIKGVYFHKKMKRWVVNCKVNSKQLYLGAFLTIEEATSVVTRFREQHHGEFINNG